MSMRTAIIWIVVLVCGAAGLAAEIMHISVMGPSRLAAARPAATAQPTANQGAWVWKREWAKARQHRVPKEYGGYRQLAWPRKLAPNLPETWARQAHLYGLPAARVRATCGKPYKVIVNKSNDTSLWIYPTRSISFHMGRCDGVAPRSRNYEKWFAQPDL